MFNIILKNILNASVILIISTVTVIAQNITLNASTDTTDYLVGDYIKYNLELIYTKNVKVFLPSVKDSIKNLEFIKQLKLSREEKNDKIIEKHIYIFSKYDSAVVTIPSYKIYYQTANDTSKQFVIVNPITITVKTLPVEPQKDIRDVKEPIKVPVNLLFIILLILLIILFLIATYFIYNYIKKKRENKTILTPELIIPPHEIALNSLRELEQKKLWQQGLIKEYHSQITEIIRKYFEDRFNIRALEMTSSEILACLSYLDEGKCIIDLANEFFNNADMVKFAKFHPMPSVNEEMMKQAYKIVSDTIPKIEQEKEEVHNVQ